MSFDLEVVCSLELVIELLPILLWLALFKKLAVYRL